MNALDRVLKDYLESPNTDYAIMISGEWGCGKSFYIHNTFSTLAKGIRVPKEGETIDEKKSFFNRESKTVNEDQKYDPVVISLYGVSSSEDFEFRVISSIHKWTNSKYFGVALGILESKGVSGGKKKFADLFSIKQNRVLIFDDLERICEEKLPIKEVLGLINTYAEHKHYKVIIICNEDYFLKKEESVGEYLKYKEKSVRFTYCYSPDIEAVFDALVNPIEGKDYREYLSSNKDGIISIFKMSGSVNIRTLKFFIDTFRAIYEVIRGVNHECEIAKCLMVSHMLYSIEYKIGKGTDDLKSLAINQYKIDIGAIRDIMYRMGDVNNDSEERDYISAFQEKYHSVYADFRCCNYLIEYVNNGYLDIDALKSDRDVMIEEFDRQILTLEGKAYKRLIQMSSLEDEELMPLINEMLNYVKEDKYSLKELLHIYTLLLQYDYWGIDGFVVTDEITNCFKQSMENQRKTHTFDDMFAVSIPILDESNNNNSSASKYSSLKDVAIAINLQSKLKSDAAKGQEFVRIAENGDIERLRNYRDKKIIIPVSGIDWGCVINLIENAPNPIACEVCGCIMSFVPGAGSINLREEERIKMELMPALDRFIHSGDRRIRRAYISKLFDHLTDAIRMGNNDNK